MITSEMLMGLEFASLVRSVVRKLASHPCNEFRLSGSAVFVERKILSVFLDLADFNIMRSKFGQGH
jgi:hypothetical protein